MAWMAAAPWIASAAGSVLSGVIGNSGQRSANRTNRDIANAQMAFQERMSNTAHQREVKDLQLAGLNPILSGTGGAGASSPSGASAVMQNAEAPLAAGVSSAAGAWAQKRSFELAKELNKATVDKSYQDQSESRTRQDLMRAQEAQTQLQSNVIQQTLPFTVSSAAGGAESINLSNTLKKADADSIKAIGESINKLDWIPSNIRDVLIGLLKRAALTGK